MLCFVLFRLIKMAGQKIVTELHRMIERPEYATISRENEGEETTIFRLVLLTYYYSYLLLLLGNYN